MGSPEKKPAEAPRERLTTSETCKGATPGRSLPTSQRRGEGLGSPRLLCPYSDEEPASESRSFYLPPRRIFDPRSPLGVPRPDFLLCHGPHGRRRCARAGSWPAVRFGTARTPSFSPLEIFTAAGAISLGLGCVGGEHVGQVLCLQPQMTADEDDRSL